MAHHPQNSSGSQSRCCMILCIVILLIQGFFLFLHVYEQYGKTPYKQINCDHFRYGPPCVDVSGKVLGDVLPGARIFLYRTSSVNYTSVMEEIRSAQPLAITTVNRTKQFVFYCLGFGNYSFVIPTTSYNGSVGFPLPYEFECPEVTLAIAFQGGNYEFAVGTFSIINTSEPESKRCDKNPYLCRIQRGSLYRECPLE